MSRLNELRDRTLRHYRVHGVCNAPDRATAKSLEVDDVGQQDEAAVIRLEGRIRRSTGNRASNGSGDPEEGEESEPGARRSRDGPRSQGKPSAAGRTSAGSTPEWSSASPDRRIAVLDSAVRLSIAKNPGPGLRFAWRDTGAPVWPPSTADRAVSEAGGDSTQSRFAQRAPEPTGPRRVPAVSVKTG